MATGKIEYGSYAALGALPAGFVSFRGVSRTRVLAVICAAAGMAVSTFVGATTAASRPWLLVPAVFAWAYVTGVLAALGPTVLAVTLQWPVALLIASALPLGPGPAVARAGLVLAGGLWQALLVVTSWAVNRGNAERTALATTYVDLAGYAADVARRAPGAAESSAADGQLCLARPQSADADGGTRAHARPGRGSRADPGHPDGVVHRPAAVLRPGPAGAASSARRHVA